MNYFAHGRRHIDDPFFLAGTAVPDWLSVVDRKVRVRSRHAKAWANDEDRQLASLAQGVLQHHFDDDWFHRTAAFAELNLQFTVAVRDALPDDEGFRPSFLGHILVELLLDAALTEEDPQRLDDYYTALESLDANRLAAGINQMAPRRAAGLAYFIGRFCQERFLYDYQDDAKLLWRLNMVMRRVGLPVLPASLAELFPQIRRQVKNRKAELLSSPPDHAST